MKNNQLLPMYKVYFRIIIIAALLIFILSFLFILNTFEQGKNKNISNIIHTMNTRKEYIEKGMALMFYSAYLQRSSIEDSLSQSTPTPQNAIFTEKFKYDQKLKISSFDTYQSKNASEPGNIIVEGKIKDKDNTVIEEMSKMQDVFKFQDYLNKNNLFDIWSVYYSGKGYITIYPFSYAKDIVDNQEEIFEDVRSSIDQLNGLDDDMIYKNGWDTDIFWDNTKSEIMFSKNLPVLLDGKVDGIVTSNISVKAIYDNIGEHKDEEIYIIDSSGQVVYKSHTPVIKIGTIYDLLKTRYNIENLKSGIETEDVHKINNDYMISENLNNVQWKMIMIVPGNKVESSLSSKVIMISLICIAIIFLVVFLLRLLKKYYEKYNRIDELKKEFLMMVSHDLKVPLSNIIGFTELTLYKFTNDIVPRIVDPSHESTKTVARIQRDIKIVKKEAGRLAEMVNDLLDLTKLESGEVRLNIEPVNIEELFSEVYGITHTLVESKNIKYTIEIEHDLQEITADKGKLLQVLVNLITNAVKFTDKGSIVCQVRKMEKGVLFSVKDTGAGIPKEMQDKIFNKFERGKYQTNRKVPGSGVGLAICKNIVELHNGKIWVESENDKGSTFNFTIPANHLKGGV